MFSEPSFFEVRQEYANESLPVLEADATTIHTTGWIPYNQINRDIQMEALAGGWQGEPIWQKPVGPGSYW